jgi:preprotein translocase subunit YajC
VSPDARTPRGRIQSYDFRAKFPVWQVRSAASGPAVLAALARKKTTVGGSNVLSTLLFSPAHAQSLSVGGTDLMAFLPMVAIFVVFYFLLIRPQQKRAKEQKAMLGALQKGDEVVTAGGLVGKIGKLTEQYATLEVSPNVEITVQRQAVSQLLPKGTIKAL